MNQSLQRTVDVPAVKGRRLTDAAVKALKGRDNILLQPSGGYTGNLLGLSDLVPMKIFFLTDGPARRVQPFAEKS